MLKKLTEFLLYEDVYIDELNSDSLFKAPFLENDDSVFCLWLFRRLYRSYAFWT